MKHVEFIKYTGAYPNLCSGILTLKIDGETVTFGSKYRKPTPMYEKFWYTIEFLNDTKFIWSKWICPTKYNDIIVTKRNGYYVCRWKYKGDKYKVYFGYGVDFDYYKKWHIVNYYRSIGYKLNKLKYLLWRK